MKKNIFLLIIICMTIISCHDVKVGYLETYAAKYNPDTMVIKKVLTDTLFPWDDDYKRYKNKADWVSAPLQGYKGTAPIFITIKNVIASNGGDAELFKQEVIIRGNGAVVIPLKNNIPLGSYTISLNLENEGYSKDLNDIFTIVVKEK